MIDIARAREIACGWHSPSPHDRNITALSHGVDSGWLADDLVTEVARELRNVESAPELDSYDANSAAELRELLEWATDQAAEFHRLITNPRLIELVRQLS